MVRFEHIEKTFIKDGRTVHALKNVNIAIDQGNIFGIIGHSGAGKSTLLRLINGLEQASSGTMSVLGQHIDAARPAGLKSIQKKIGMVFQHFNLLNSKTVFDNVALPLRLSKTDSALCKQRVMDVLEDVGLADKADARPHQLSGGQKQRVGIARALVNQPDILLCDEATSALDPQTTASILSILKKINQEQGVTIVLITHEMEVIQKICNRVAVMSAGEVVEQGLSSDIFQYPRHAVTKEFIGSVIQKNFPKNLMITLSKTLPDEQQIIRLEFLQQSAQQTVINDVLLAYSVKINILFANMIEINGQVIGSMFVQLTGLAEDRRDAVQYLLDRNVLVDQELTYV